MSLLRPEEMAPLRGILKSHFLIASDDPEDRRALMTACGAGALCDRVGLGKPGERFASELLSKLEGRGPVGDPGLAVFLDRFLVAYPDDATEEEKAFIRAITGRGNVIQKEGGGETNMTDRATAGKTPQSENESDAGGAPPGEPDDPRHAAAGGQTPARTGAWNPLTFARNFLRDAIEAVPAVKYALGVGGLASVVAIVTGRFGLGLDPRFAVVGGVVMIVMMVVLVIFARGTEIVGGSLRLPVMALTWFALLLFMAASTLLLTSVFFMWPLDLKHWLM